MIAGQTVIAGGTIDHAVWDANGSPYLVTGDVWVPHDLTVMEGTRIILFASKLRGVINILGTQANPVHFSVRNGSLLEVASDSTRWAIFQQDETEIEWPQKQPSLGFGLLRDTIFKGPFYIGAGAPYTAIEGLTLWNSHLIVGRTAPVSGTCYSKDIHQDNPILKRSIFYNSTLSISCGFVRDLQIFGPSYKNGYAVGLSGGILPDPTLPLLQNVTITGFPVGCDPFSIQTGHVTLRYNNIFGNKCNIETKPTHDSSGSIDAKFNYWGFTSEASIRQRMCLANTSSISFVPCSVKPLMN
ncbi:MAG: hypothetical protein ACXV2C_00030 [Candidatus Bathyarchaeia archaeon]